MDLRKQLAKIISFIFHPLLMPVAGTYIIFLSNTTESLLPVEFRTYIYLLVFGGTCCLPLCLLPLYIYWKSISSPYMNESGERNTPLIFTFFLYLLTTYYLNKIPVQYINLIIIFIGACSISIFLNFIINLKWKISSHLIGIGGIIGLIVIMRLLQLTPPLYFLILAIITGGLLFWARIESGSHNWKQALAGLGLGIVVVPLTILIFEILF